MVIVVLESIQSREPSIGAKAIYLIRYVPVCTLISGYAQMYRALQPYFEAARMSVNYLKEAERFKSTLKPN